jgi:hypothetical protein
VAGGLTHRDGASTTPNTWTRASIQSGEVSVQLAQANDRLEPPINAPVATPHAVSVGTPPVTVPPQSVWVLSCAIALVGRPLAHRVEDGNERPIPQKRECRFERLDIGTGHCDMQFSPVAYFF